MAQALFETWKLEQSEKDRAEFAMFAVVERVAWPSAERNATDEFLRLVKEFREREGD